MNVTAFIWGHTKKESALLFVVIKYVLSVSNLPIGKTPVNLNEYIFTHLSHWFEAISSVPCFIQRKELI